MCFKLYLHRKLLCIFLLIIVFIYFFKLWYKCFYPVIANKLIKKSKTNLKKNISTAIIIVFELRSECICYDTFWKRYKLFR